MALDRGLQLRILESLAAIYPASAHGLAKMVAFEGEPMTLIANTHYLAEHGLVQGGFEDVRMLSHDGPPEERFVEHQTIITAHGMDFLADDGGLGAILKTVTVRLDAAQLAEILARKVEQLAGVPPEEKASIANELRKLPAKAAEKLVEKLIDFSIEHAGDALPAIRAVLGGLA